MITWMNRLPAVEIEFIGAGGPAAAVWRHYSRFGVEVRAFLMTTDLPPSVVMAVAFDDNPDDRPRWSAWAATSTRLGGREGRIRALSSAAKRVEALPGNPPGRSAP